MNTDEIARALSNYAAGVTYEKLPEGVVSALKLILLDTLGTTLAATTLGTGCRELVGVGLRAGGAEECWLLGLAQRVPALFGALVNGGLSHALNYDDVSVGGAGHLGVTSIPAALAVAEKAGGVSGKQFLAALAAGCEVMARIGAGISRAEEGFTEAKPQPTQMPGYFSCAASAGRVLCLTPRQMHSAFALALMQCSGGRQPVLEGRPAKAIYAAFCNHGGVLSALLSQEGLEADCDVFTGEAGFFKTYYHGRYDRAALLDGLGERFTLLAVGFKPWPTTAAAHPFIQAAIELRLQHGLRPHAIEKVHLRGGDHARTFCEPLATRLRPRTPVQAEDSIPFSVAKALANGTVTLADLQPGSSGLDQPAAVRLAGRTSYSVDSALERTGVVEVTTEGGQHHAVRVDIPPGHPSRPLSHEQLLEKFMDCAGHSSCPIEKQALEQVVQLIDQLEGVDDVSVIPALLSGRSVPA